MGAEYEIYQIYNNLSTFHCWLSSLFIVKTKPLHVHKIALTFIAISSMLGGGLNLLSSLKEDKNDIIENNDDGSI